MNNSDDFKFISCYSTRWSSYQSSRWDDVSSLELDKEFESFAQLLKVNGLAIGKWLIFEVTPLQLFHVLISMCTLHDVMIRINDIDLAQNQKNSIKKFLLRIIYLFFLEIQNRFFYIYSKFFNFVFYFIFCSAVCNKLHSGNAYCIRFLNILFLYFNFLIKLWNCILHFS